jgi:hypothetical protein
VVRLRSGRIDDAGDDVSRINIAAQR